ncbi:WGR domain-containing protein [Komagataeibacter diospyri]
MCYTFREIMPRPAPKAPVRPPRQLPLFPETAALVRVDPAANCWRFYHLSLQPDLFGGTALVRQWGRIGTVGRQICELHDDVGQALDALARQLRAKRRRGYRDRTAG